MSDKELIAQLKLENNALRNKLKELQRKIQYSGGKSVKPKKVKTPTQPKLDINYDWATRYDHPLWKKRRQQILQKDNYTCTKCGCKHNLHVHHTLYEKGYHVWEYPSSYLITLCSTCHEQEHKGRPIESFINKGEPIPRWVVK